MCDLFLVLCGIFVGLVLFFQITKSSSKVDMSFTDLWAMASVTHHKLYSDKEQHLKS